MNSYYDLLGVPSDATEGTIQQAYNNIIAELYQELINNSITGEQYNQVYSACTEAKDVLMNAESRARYDEKLGNLSPEEAFRRGAAQTGADSTSGREASEYADDDFDDDFDDDLEDENPGKRKWGKIALITGAAVAVVAASCWLGPKIARNIHFKTNNQTPVGVTDEQGEQKTEQGEQKTGADSTSGVTKGDATGSTEDTEEKKDGVATGSSGTADDTSMGSTGAGTQEQQGVPTLRNYGDIKDTSLVGERATILLDQLNNANMTNLTTGLPYTIEELETLILYVNGEYVPESEEEASTLYTEFLNFICAPINIDDTLIQSAYLGGEDSFKSTVEGFVANQKRPDIVTAFTYGDSYAAPYLYWLQGKYYDMRYTTDRDEATKIFNEVFQSIADIMKGDGFVLDGVTYHEKNILGLDKVGVSNLYIYFGLNAEVFRTTKTQDNYTVVNHLISADPEMQKDTVSYDEIGTWLNGACDVSLIALDDEGRPLITSGEEGKTLGELTQINTIYRAKDNYLNDKTKTLSK